VLILLAEERNNTAANKLLKIIEEPPEKTFFLLVAQSTAEILPTILSRTQLIKINKIPDEVLTNYLLDKYPEKEDTVRGITRLEDGNFLSAVNLIESDEQNKIYFDHFVKWMRFTYSLKIPELLDWIPQMAEMGREKQKDFLIFCLRMIKENYHMNRKVTEIIRMSPEEEEFSQRFHNFVNSANIEDLHRLISEAVSQIGMNANPRILFLDLSTRIYQQLRKPVVQ